MERKLLVEVTEEEYQKIKDGILEEEPKVVTEIKEVQVVKNREVPVINTKQFKFGLDRKVSFIMPYGKHQKCEYEGTIVGFVLTKYPPLMSSADEQKKLVPLYQIKFFDKDYEFDNFIWLEEKDVTPLED